MNPVNNTGYDSTARYVAYAALFLVVIIMIAIIVFAVYYVRNPDIISDATKTSLFQNGTVTSGETFIASPLSVYIVNPGIATGFTVKVQAYPSLSADLTAMKTGFFKISNMNTGAFPISVVDPAITVQGSSVINNGVTAEFMWFNPTTIRRIVIA